MIICIRINADDFSRLFDTVELCSVNPYTILGGNMPVSHTSPATQSKWTIHDHEGSWVPGSSAGGSRRYNRTFINMFSHNCAIEELL